MLAIQANEQGHPIVVELDVKAKTFKEVDSERWSEFLAVVYIENDETNRAIIPVEVKGHFQPWMFNSMVQIEKSVTELSEEGTK